MFGGKKIQELESKLSELQGKFDALTKENGRLTGELDSAHGKIADLEAQLNDFDLEKLKEDARASRAEYEGLKDLYASKNKEFDDNVEEEEQKFAREAARKRFDLDNEIRDNRQANQDHVANTVRTFSESYNYYLNQIKLLMDALGDVAVKTGEALFSEENADLKTRIAQQMRERLKSDTDSLKSNDGDLVLIGSAEAVEEEPEPFFGAEEPAEDAYTQDDDAAEAPAEPSFGMTDAAQAYADALAGNVETDEAEEPVYEVGGAFAEEVKDVAEELPDEGTVRVFGIQPQEAGEEEKKEEF